MIIELVVVVLAAICAVSYVVYRYRERAKCVVHWYRERANWAKIREENVRKLKRLKEKFEEEKRRGGMK